MKRLTRRGRQTSRRGVTTVEFAIVLPVFLTLLIGLMEFVRISNLRHAADNAAYEAARHVMVPGAKASEAIALANDLLRRGGIRRATVTVTPSTIVESTTAVTVRVSVPLTGNSWLPPKLTRSRTLAREATLLTERSKVLLAQEVAAGMPSIPSRP
jgi:Flp pilus assembly protein TadG